MKKAINNFYKEITLSDKNGKNYQHVVFDYQKIYDDKVPIFLIISERGSKAKTTQAKKLAIDIWHKEGLRTLWVMNTIELLKGEKVSHLTKPKKYIPESFGPDMEVSGKYVYDNTPNEKRNNWYTKFSPLSTAENEKGSRDDYGLLIYEEFNVGLTLIRHKQVELLSNLIGTLSDPINIVDDKFKKLIIHGNYKSLNNQFLIDMGITKLDKEITDIYIGKFLLMRILLPTFTEKDKLLFKERNQDNWKYLLQEKLGKADHVFFNENLFDEVNNVNDYMITLPIKNDYIIKVSKYFYQARIITSGDLGVIIYIMGVDRPKEQDIYCLNRLDISEGIMFNTNLKRNLLKLLTQDKLYFKSAYVRENIINVIRK